MLNHEPSVAPPSRLLASRPQVRAGFCSERGSRPDNQDYVGLWLDEAGRGGSHGIIAAVADGVGGAKGGRVAAELAVRGLIDGLLGQSPALPTQQVAARAVEAVNAWIHTQGRTDPAFEGMACTLTALVLRGRCVHVLHVGDSRLYRLRGEVLGRLTTDHGPGATGGPPLLSRAVGAAESVRMDYMKEAAQSHDRYLLCSDGVHGVLSDRALLAELGNRASPEETARRLVAAATATPQADNATALVVDILDLPPPDQHDLAAVADALPVLPVPQRGATVDGFLLEEIMADNRYSRVFRGRDTLGNRPVVLKFPKPGTAAEASFRQAFLRESWIAARIRNPFVGEVLELPPERQGRLYSAMPLYEGETLERRLLRGPQVSLVEGFGIAVKLAKAVNALHRAGIVHRDIKPENIILERGGGLKLIDLGVARLPNLEDFVRADIPGTPSYMAPELHAGKAGDAQSDIFAMGVTLYRLFSGGAYPYGEVEPFSHPRFKRPASLLARRPDLPAWLDDILCRAVAVSRADRYSDPMELVAEVELAMARGAPRQPRPHSWYDRNPMLFWQVACALLAVLLLALASRQLP